jgi:hypothetical protein
MQKARAKAAKISGRRTVPKGLSRLSREITASDVTQNLLRLFEGLGIDISHLMPSPATTAPAQAASHILYRHTSAIGELLTSWHQEPGYQTEEGMPMRVKLRGPRPSFHALARRFLPEVDDSYLLNELQRLGIISIDERKFAQVRMRSFPAYEDQRLAAQHTLTALNGFITTLRHNLNSAPSNANQLFHRVAWNNNFDARKIPALKIKMRRQGQNFLEASDDWLTRNEIPKSKKLSRQTKRAQVSIGVYLSIE